MAICASLFLNVRFLRQRSETRAVTEIICISCSISGRVCRSRCYLSIHLYNRAGTFANKTVYILLCLYGTYQFVDSILLVYYCLD